MLAVKKPKITKSTNLNFCLLANVDILSPRADRRLILGLFSGAQGRNFDARTDGALPHFRAQWWRMRFDTFGGRFGLLVFILVVSFKQ